MPSARITTADTGHDLTADDACPTIPVSLDASDRRGKARLLWRDVWLVVTAYLCDDMPFHEACLQEPVCGLIDFLNERFAAAFSNQRPIALPPLSLKL